jgi:hypothetical protein
MYGDADEQTVTVQLRNDTGHADSRVTLSFTDDKRPSAPIPDLPSATMEQEQEKKDKKSVRKNAIEKLNDLFGATHRYRGYIGQG